jgi:protein-disulfide isomerase
MRSLLLALTLLPLALNCSHAADNGAPAGTEPVINATAAHVVDAPVAPEIYRVPVDGLPILGDDHALVTVVEFTDYQCPFCARADSTVAQLRSTYGADLRVAVASHPLPFHDRARPAALAALAAAAQAKFEPMHARLFAGTREPDDATIAAEARDAGLDLVRFDADRKSAAVGGELDRMVAFGRTLGVTGTPTFFVNGRLVVGAQPLATFQSVIEEELARAQTLVASGVKREDVYANVLAHATATAIPAAEPGSGSCDGEGDCKGEGGDTLIGAKVEAVRIDGSPVRGGAHAPVTIVEFTDFECPFCAHAEERVRAIATQYGNRVRVVYKSLPLPMHGHARMAAKAALAAGVQGKFWEYHDALFAHQNALDRASLDGYAKTLGLDVARFDRDVDSSALESAVVADEEDAKALGAGGTPTFFVNGRRVVGAQPIEVFKTAVDKGLSDP